ncbi:DUF4189 domain-containing protein [Gordonia sp. ABSL1-1]|uniref:DUF4189 domain-containing protein n=1 Tax=Gordonia sp. ABSL1-1 TaxID=3053923 RepID=UPI002573C8EF|nr:DUF4189 domain-containing protein [Gordonia sp. ABSL1-1]MDL9938182.1 DUF4189 domain-containing protein [Gordonia sp. ABSL1-1]
MNKDSNTNAFLLVGSIVLVGVLLVGGLMVMIRLGADDSSDGGSSAGAHPNLPGMSRIPGMSTSAPSDSDRDSTPPGDGSSESDSDPSYPTTTTPTIPTTTTTTPEPIRYGAIAFSGSRAYATRLNYSDPTTAKNLAVGACNQSIWNAGWPSDSYCGWVGIQTGYCGSVSVGTSGSGWGPTGYWSASLPRAQVREAAIQKCNTYGPGCTELITLCM